ncbi:MAG TPA: ATP-binding cassette domain-containing protein [Balneolales bacterium]|nr:ATP-binding cassette domain-containing protein [Balneolales bacterium]
MSVIDVTQVTKKYGSLRAVDRVSFSVDKGRIFGLLGPNGAGKTSTIRMINYITAPDEGSISIMGQAVGSQSQQLIGYLPEERGLYKKMKVGEQLLYLAQLKGMSVTDAQKAINHWLERFDAVSWQKKETHELSKGMQQKIQFIATIAHDPDIYIFDEPFSGLDPINSELLKKVIIELRDKGKTILFATHRMEQVEQMCDDICLFNKGKAILQGKLSDIKRSFGRNTVILEFEGDGSFIDELENVRINNRSTNYAEIRLLNGLDEQVILQKAIQNVTLLRFEFVQPSLNEIFISTVGEDNIKNQLTKAH